MTIPRSEVAIAVVVGRLLSACGNDEPVVPGQPNAEIQTGTLIGLADGKVQGSAEGGARRFAGIPYAKPPVGALRFKAPIENDPWTGIRDATDFGGRCAQPDSLNTGPGTDNEDCLYLNVWSPDPAPSELLPVMVWIHGGGNQNGATSDLLPVAGGRLFYDGQSLAQNHGVVVVSMNYRLGVFGYLAHAALRAEGSPSGNQGLLDQQLALAWVRDNIAVFGGDPNNVTIFGESAGARNVCFHLTSPGSLGLFQRAIGESGDCTTPGAASISPGRIPLLDEAEAQTLAFAEAVGCGATADTLACLRQKPASELLVDAPLDGAAPDPVPGGTAYAGGTPRWEFRPIVDGAVVPAIPSELFAQGATAHIPYLLGTNTEEGALAHLTAPAVNTEADYLQALQRRFGAFSTRVAAAYPVSAFATPNAALIRVTTDSRYACGVQDFAEKLSQQTDVYLYNFDLAYAIPGLEQLGPAHGAELTFVFGSLGPDQWPPGDERISDLMQGYWSRFARTSDPNGDGAPPWSTFSAALKNRLNIDLDPNSVDSFRAEQCALWSEYYATLL